MTKLRLPLLALGLGFALAFSCSVPDRGIVVDGSVDGGAGEGGGSGGSDEPSGGNSSGGSSLGGANTGGASLGGSGGTSGTGGVPSDCEDDDDCSGVVPICDSDSSECRACASGNECEAISSAAPLCATSGACVECLGDDDCEATEPVCDEGACRGCEEHSECESLVCGTDGACVDQAAVVYALAVTGSYDNSCGTLDLPCRLFSEAVGQLSASRSTLVLIPTTEAFEEGSEGAVVLPTGVDVTILGNSVELVLRNDPGIAISGGSVHLDQLFVTGTGGLETDPAQYLVHMTGGELEITRSAFHDSRGVLSATDVGVSVFDSSFIDLGGGIDVGCTTDCASVSPLRLERNRFENLVYGAVWAEQPGAYIANNVFAQMAVIDYSTGLDVGDGSVMEFNTIVRSGNCLFNNLIQCGGSGTVLRGNITHESTTLATGGPCYGQIYASNCASPEYSLGEVTLPGTGNDTGDPMFVDDDGGDFHLTADSPAVDLAPSDSSELADDYDGNPRPVGSGRDAGAFERQ